MWTLPLHRFDDLELSKAVHLGEMRHVDAVLRHLLRVRSNAQRAQREPVVASGVEPRNAPCRHGVGAGLVREHEAIALAGSPAVQAQASGRLSRPSAHTAPLTVETKAVELALQ